eukprot:IDg23709t1
MQMHLSSFQKQQRAEPGAIAPSRPPHAMSHMYTPSMSASPRSFVGATTATDGAVFDDRNIVRHGERNGAGPHSSEQKIAAHASFARSDPDLYASATSPIVPLRRRAAANLSPSEERVARKAVKQRRTRRSSKRAQELY